MVESFMIALLFLFAIHWYGDFYCQTHWQATNKSKNLAALASHVGAYTAVLAVGTLLLFHEFLTFTEAWIGFIVTNGIAHFLTDAITSRFTAYHFGRNDPHNGFVVVGIDQWIHHVTLMVTMYVAFYYGG